MRKAIEKEKFFMQVSLLESASVHLDTKIERNAQGRRILDRYTLINHVNQEEAQRIHELVGINIPFNPGETLAKPIIGKGYFGKFRLAILDKETYLGVKKIKHPDAIRESKNEAKIQQKLLNKPHIMPLYDFIEAPASKTRQPAYYQFMPLAGLGNVAKLQTQLNQLNDFPLKELVITHIAQSLLLGLWHMHQAGIYHLDVKPDNLVVDKDGLVYLIDFGCAVEVKEKQPLLRAMQNAEGVQVGKGDSNYFSPSRYRAMQNQTSFNCSKADLFAAGLSILELLAGRRCYLEEVSAEISSSQLFELVQVLLDEESENYPTTQEVLNFPVFQQPEIHDPSVIGTAISYLKEFVHKSHFQLNVNQLSLNPPPNSVQGISYATPLTGLPKQDLHAGGYEVVLKGAKKTATKPLLSTTPTQKAEQTDNLSYAELRNLRARLFQNQSKEIKEALSMYVPLQGSKDRQDRTGFDLEELVNQWLQNDQQVLLLLADGGSGKSIFCHHLFQKLERSNNNKTLLAIHVSLASVRHPKQLLEELFKNRYGLNERQIAFIKTNLRFLLILDGYDEMKESINLFVENRWQDWQVKILITCRSTALQNDYLIHFLPYQPKKEALSLFQELYILPFSPSHVRQYIDIYHKVQKPQLVHAVQQGELDKKWLNIDSYQETLQALPGLSELVQTPFLLRLTLDVLPRLAQTHHQRLTAVDIYEAFMEQWIVQQIAKNNTLTLSSEEIWDFGQRLAEKMFAEDVTEIQFTSRWVFDPEMGNYREEKDPWSDYLSEQNAYHRALRLSLPLYQVRERTYSFIHLSILEYLNARKWYHEFKLYQLSAPSLRVFSLTKDEKNINRLRFLADWVWSDEVYKELLFKIIAASKTTSDLSLLASTAITILNYAGVSLSGLDLSEISIPYADLSSAILDQTDLTNTDLTGVKLRDSWLRGAKLSQACLQEVFFGEKPSLNLGSHVKQVTFSPDGRFLASFSKGRVWLWDAQTSKNQLNFANSNDEAITCIAFSPDSQKIASVALGILSLWSTDHGQRVHTMKIGWATCITFSPDGESIIIDRNSDLQIWQVKESQMQVKFNDLEEASRLDKMDDLLKKMGRLPKKILSGHQKIITSIACSSDYTLASGSEDQTIRLWSFDNGQVKHILKGHTETVTCINFNSDNTKLVSGSADKTVKLWVTISGQLLHTFTGHTAQVNSVAFSPDQKVIASGSEDKSINLWSMANHEVQTLGKHARGVNSIAYRLDGQILASGSHDGIIRLWPTKVAQKVRQGNGHQASVRSLSVSSDQSMIASGSIDKTIKLWSPSGQVLYTLSGHKGGIASVAFNPNHTILASAGWDQTIKLWDIETKQLLHTLEGHSDLVFCVSFSPDGSMIASASQDESLRVWEVARGKIFYHLQGKGGWVSSVAFSPNNKILASGHADCTVKLWSLETQSLQKTLSGHEEGVMSLSFSHDGLTLATASVDKTIRLWSVSSGKSTHILKGHQEFLKNVAFSPNGLLLASGSEDKTVRIWSATTGECLTVIDGYLEGVNAVTWLSNDCLLTGSADSAIKCWQVIKNQNKVEMRLIWNTHPHFYAKDCLIDQVIGLSPENISLMKERGARSSPTDNLTNVNANSSVDNYDKFIQDYLKSTSNINNNSNIGFIQGFFNKYFRRG